MTTAERVAAALGAAVVDARPVAGGYSTAERLVVTLDDGRSVFAKCGREAPVDGFLRDEYRFYAAVTAEFVPRCLAFLDEHPPVLVLEDLSGAYWPPPWRPGDVEAVLETLDVVHATPPPESVPPIEHAADRLTGGWRQIAVDRAPFLSVGVCSRGWLEDALPTLIDATASAPIAGGDLIHLDVRSDNVCIRDGGAVLVDWNQACIANGELDLAAWLPSLHVEGGPRPDDVLADAGELAALLAGFFGSRAGLPPPATAPHVRPIQLAQLRVALPWAARALGLPEPR